MDLFEEIENKILGGLTKLDDNGTRRLRQFSGRVSHAVLGSCLRYIIDNDFPSYPSVFLTPENHLELMWREEPDNTVVLVTFTDTAREFYNERLEEEWSE